MINNFADQIMTAIQKHLQTTKAAFEGNTELWDMAEYLDVDEEFLRDYLIYQGILDIYL